MKKKCKICTTTKLCKKCQTSITIELKRETEIESQYLRNEVDRVNNAMKKFQLQAESFLDTVSSFKDIKEQKTIMIKLSKFVQTVSVMERSFRMNQLSYSDIDQIPIMLRLKNK